MKNNDRNDGVAEGVGFEPTIRFSPYTHFPGARLQPLGHPSSSEGDRPGTARNLANGGAQGNTRSSACLGRRVCLENQPIKSQRISPPRAGAESTDPGYNRPMSPLRIVGLGLIAIACLFGFANVWYWFLGHSGGLSLYDVWNKFLPSSLNMMQRYLWTGLWNGIYIILVQPAWLVMGILGAVCVGLGRRTIE